MEWEKIMNVKFDKFKKAAVIRKTLSQIQNKENALGLEHLWEYKNKKPLLNVIKFQRTRY